jgi:hypothetical protein
VQATTDSMQVFFGYPRCGINSFVERLCNKKLITVGVKHRQLELGNRRVAVMNFVPPLVKGTSVSFKSVFICFSVVNRDSFESIKEMYKQHWQEALQNNPCHKILVGLNVDMRTTSKASQKKVTTISSNQNELPNYFAMLPKGM